LNQNGFFEFEKAYMMLYDKDSFLCLAASQHRYGNVTGTIPLRSRFFPFAFQKSVQAILQRQIVSSVFWVLRKYDEG